MHVDDLDAILDRGLRSYSAAEPLAGMEERIIRKIQPSRAQRPWWMLAIPAAAALVLVWVMPGPTRQVSPRKEPVIRHAVIAAAPSAPVEHLTERRTHPRTTKASPRGLTPEERAMVALATQHPELALQASMERPIQPLEPLDIPAIEVPPLSTDNTN